MQRQSPPKHRHDGTSPLPLGMDWSPPPKNWAGRETVWPHDPHTGWSYCVTIPSRVVLAKSTNSDPIVFYRVLVGLQSPEGNTTTRVVLRRFNDFLKFLAALKRMFPRKNIPPAPPKGFLRMKTRTLLEERRSSLEEWMTKLLSDIDVSRSVPVASFLELEAAARSSFLDENQHASESNPSVNSSVSSLQVHPNLSLSAIAGSSSLTSDYGSDTAYEISDVGTPRLGRDNNSDFGTDDLSLDEDATSPIDKFVKFGMSNIDEGLFMGQAILEQLGNYPRHRVHSRESNKFEDNNKANGNASKSSDLVVGTDGMNRLSLERENTKVIRHARKLSGESIGSDTSSQRGSELSGSAIPSLYGQGLVDVPRAAETSANIENTDLLLPSDVQLLLLSDQRQKMNRVLATMQRRLITAKTDMEDLISRLNQEIAVKDYLTTKVKDLEVELEATKQKSKENLEQAILVERERVTQIQWDMEELRRKSLEMELKLNPQKDKLGNASMEDNASPENDRVLQELDATKRKLDELQKQHQELEVKSKADLKILIKEVRSLRVSQADLKQQLNHSLKEKLEAERLYEEERKANEQARTSFMKLLNECQVLRQRFEECNINLVNENEDDLAMDPSCSDALNLLTTYDNQINLILSEVNTDQGADSSSATAEKVNDVNTDSWTVDEKLRNMLTNVLVDNGKLRKQVNSVMRYALKKKMSSPGESEDPSSETIQNKHLDS
ncbi:PX domain-containing protein EREL2 isoform X2 [Lycium barbarum]|uniref:PX domain-containing protein EREL2 isoform X2 n=1 Tax=Lycium barbarum TaxID=112863 RepID=UPI00293EB868|nr:PX domain-containing protein EREL2 isoform X2 [Lycium barbarum]